MDGRGTVDLYQSEMFFCAISLMTFEIVLWIDVVITQHDRVPYIFCDDRCSRNRGAFGFSLKGRYLSDRHRGQGDRIYDKHVRYDAKIIQRPRHRHLSRLKDIQPVDFIVFHHPDAYSLRLAK